MTMTKTCTKCKVEQPISNFSKHKLGKNGLSSQCKECMKENSHRHYVKNREKYVKAHREYYYANKEKFKELHAEWYKKNKEYVNQKHREYHKQNKEKDRERQKKYYERPETKAHMVEYRKKNREHIREVNKKWRDSNREELRRRRREYYLKNKEKHAEWHKNYRERHTEKIKEHSKEYRKQNKDKINQAHLDRLHNDPVFKLKEQARNMLRCAFRTKGHKKESRSADIVGCSLDELYVHLAQTWEKRYGTEWNGQPCHIDHITPLATAKTKEDVIRLCHYTNLQLLTPEDNMKKGDRTL